MKKLGRILVGYRDDLDLASRWWHRLLKVTGILGLVALGGLAVLVLNGGRIEPVPSDVRINANLREFTKKSAPDIANTIPLFLALPGQLGGIKDGKVVYVSDYFLAKDVCSADLAANAVQVVEVMNAAEYDQQKRITAAQLVEYINKEESSRKAGADKRYCWLSNDVGVASDQIIKYEITGLGIARRLAGILLSTGMFVVGVVFVALNMYYRGVIYIIFGKRRPSAAA